MTTQKLMESPKQQPQQQTQPPPTSDNTTAKTTTIPQEPGQSFNSNNPTVMSTTDSGNNNSTTTTIIVQKKSFFERLRSGEVDLRNLTHVANGISTGKYLISSYCHIFSLHFMVLYLIQCTIKYILFFQLLCWFLISYGCVC